MRGREREEVGTELDRGRNMVMERKIKRKVEKGN